MEPTILIVEDEPRLADIEQKYLHQAGYATHIINEGSTVVSWVKDNTPALLLLDLMLPGKDGLEICREIRQFSQVPIIMVTARVEEIDRLLGLELGADDYICKPFSPREIVARVKAVLRRGASPSRPNDAPLQLDEERYTARLNGNDLHLTALEFRLLHLLASRPGVIYSRDQLMEHIYTDQRIVYDRTIDSHIRNLRKKIHTVQPECEIIRSVYGVGYKYEIE